MPLKQITLMDMKVQDPEWNLGLLAVRLYHGGGSESLSPALSLGSLLDVEEVTWMSGRTGALYYVSAK